MAFLREFYLSGSYKDCCNMKVICLIEISSCLVKHTEVTQKYISELTELKRAKIICNQTKPISAFPISCSAFCLPDSLNILRKCREHFVWNLRHTNTHIYRETFTDTLIEKIPFRNVILKSFLAN